jgi:hypothetical protein
MEPLVLMVPKEMILGAECSRANGAPGAAGDDGSDGGVEIMEP